MKQLTKDEIQQLFDLVQGHAIKYYDVQVEIVDHFASAIEEIWETEPNLSFFHAKNRIYRQFWNFKQLEEEKRKALIKKYNKLSWRTLLDWMKFPKVVCTLLLILSLFLLFSQSDTVQKYVMVGILLFGMLLNFYPLLGYFKIKWRFQKEFLHLDCVMVANSTIVMLSFWPIQWINIDWNHFYDLPFAVYVSFWVIMNIISCQLISKTTKTIASTFLNLA